jgi:hypothetical protein
VAAAGLLGLNLFRGFAGSPFLSGVGPGGVRGAALRGGFSESESLGLSLPLPPPGFVGCSWGVCCAALFPGRSGRLSAVRLSLLTAPGRVLGAAKVLRLLCGSFPGTLVAPWLPPTGPTGACPFGSPKPLGESNLGGGWGFPHGTGPLILCLPSSRSPQHPEGNHRRTKLHVVGTPYVQALEIDKILRISPRGAAAPWARNPAQDDAGGDATGRPVGWDASGYLQARDGREYPGTAGIRPSLPWRGGPARRWAHQGKSWSPCQRPPVAKLCASAFGRTGRPGRTQDLARTVLNWDEKAPRRCGRDARLQPCSPS